MPDVSQITALLEESYGCPEYKPSYNLLDELIYTILSQTTSAVNYNRAFNNLKEQFNSWEEVRTADSSRIEDAIRVGGLAKIKSQRIKNILNQIYTMRHELSLEFLADMPAFEARDYLMQFDGVGIKTASCVLMFSLHRPVLPVDTHVHRITQRLGVIDKSVNAEAAHAVLQQMVPDELVYSFHVNLVAHGRQVCKAQNPACDICSLLSICPYGKKTLSLGGT